MGEIDRLTTERLGTPPLMLMESAATAVARLVTEHLAGDVSGKSVLVLCGRGNNGGDGAATARLLALAGWRVSLALFGKVEDTKGDARANFAAAYELAGDGPGQIEFAECESTEDWSALLNRLTKSAKVVIDALFGTGLTRPVADDSDYPELLGVGNHKGMHIDSGVAECACELRKSSAAVLKEH